MKINYLKTIVMIVVSVFITFQFSFGQCPTIICPSDIIVSNNAGLCGAVVNFTPPVGTNPCGVVTTTFDYSGSIVNWTVPVGVTSVTIEAWGAQGGTTNGGLGADIKGTFTVIPGNVLGIVVGGQGTFNSCGSSPASGGGGGGSFVWLTTNNTLPMIAAGGGGGGNTNWGGACTIGIDASVGTSGTASNGGYALGGINGNGGAGNAPSGTGSGGGGWLTAGQNSTYGTGCTGGQPAFIFTGGSGSTTFGPGGDGGFGGGGGAVCGCGGGGGYSGGGGGEGSTCRAGGGGGGSYNAGTNQINTASVQTGNGQVTISYVVLPTTTQTAGLPSGSTFPVGVTTQTYTVTDQLLNSSSCSFTITVNDTTAPVVTCPSNITVNHDAGMCGAVVTFSPPVGVDNCVAHTETFYYNGAVQSWTVPVGVTSIHIDAEGAQGGGTSNGTSGGLGAKMTGDFTVTPGTSLNIVVGQKGLEQVGGNVQNSSGGGGGTFVYTAGPVLMVAAGGGGGKCNYTGSSPLHPDADGKITTNGGASSDGNLGGTLGNGGNVGYFSGGWNDGGGGAGWLTPGGDATLGGKNAPTWLGGNPYCGGGGGGCGGYGGFGGGGGGGNDYGGGGGGGGYSGGGGGTDPTHGGGGGSYSIGTNQLNTPGFKTDDGLVIISYDLPATTVLTSGLPSGSTFPVGTTTESYTTTDFAGNSSSCSFTVNVNSIDTSVTVNQQTLTSNETGTYQWYNCNTSSIIPGAISVSYTATSNGSYAVIVTENGCTDTSSCHTITTVDINEVANNFNIDVYPNPTNSNVTIDIPQDIDPVNINIADISGKIVFSQFQINSKHTILDLKQFTPGVYFMKLFNDDNSKVIKLVKF